MFLDTQYLANQPVTISEVLRNVLYKPIGLCTRGDAMRVGQILRRLGWGPRGKARPRKYYQFPRTAVRALLRGAAIISRATNPRSARSWPEGMDSELQTQPCGSVKSVFTVASLRRRYDRPVALSSIGTRPYQLFGRPFALEPIGLTASALPIAPDAPPSSLRGRNIRRLARAASARGSDTWPATGTAA